MEKRGELVPQSDMDALVDEIVGATLVGLKKSQWDCPIGPRLLLAAATARAYLDLMEGHHIGAPTQATQRAKRASA